jgi:hypothetical protein
LNIPTLAVDGWGDGGYNNLQFCRWLALRGLGADARGLWGHHGHSYQPYEDVEEFQQIMGLGQGPEAELFPSKVRFATWNLAWNRALLVFHRPCPQPGADRAVRSRSDRPAHCPRRDPEHRRLQAGLERQTAGPATDHRHHGWPAVVRWDRSSRSC